MRLRAAFWTERGNLLIVTCSCGHIFLHRTDRHRVRCPNCPRTTSITVLRRQRLPDIE